MKKHYVLGLALCTSFAVNAQIITDFESTILTPNTYNNGADLSGGFTYNVNPTSPSDSVHFSNYYDTTYNFNTGFSISNITNNTTPGFTNQYSAITGSGYNSSNYAVFYPDGEITLVNGPFFRVLHSVEITNTTYAALSMMNGDGVGKKFGDSTNALGQVDGTNGEDYFILKIYGRMFNGDTTGTVEVVLADFRFANDSLDYIVQDWINVDLFPLNNPTGSVEFISFAFESSDIGTFGINTPTYFAMDDLVYSLGIVGLRELSNDFQVYPNPIKDVLHINGMEGNLKIYDSFGKIVFASHLNQKIDVDFSQFTSGVYFVSIENQSGTFTKKVIK